MKKNVQMMVHRPRLDEDEGRIEGDFYLTPKEKKSVDRRRFIKYFCMKENIVQGLGFGGFRVREYVAQSLAQDQTEISIDHKAVAGYYDLKSCDFVYRGLRELVKTGWIRKVQGSPGRYRINTDYFYNGRG